MRDIILNCHNYINSGRSDFQKMFLDGDADGFGAALCAKLAADGIDVLIDGISGNVELCGDLFA